MTIHTAARARSQRRSARIPTVATVTLAVLLTACGGGSSKKSTSDGASTSSSTPLTTKGAEAETPSVVDIQACDRSGGKGKASGTVENRSSTATGYHLQIGFYDSETNALLGDGSTETGRVEPGASATWEVTASNLEHVDVVCHVTTIEDIAGGAPTTVQ